VRQSYRRRLQIFLAKKLGTEVVHVVPNWMYRSGTDGGPERDIVICVVPKWTGIEVDRPLVPNASSTERDLPLENHTS